jgi:hypothetical protein
MANDVEAEEAEKYFGGTKRQNLGSGTFPCLVFGRVWLSNLRMTWTSTVRYL